MVLFLQSKGTSQGTTKDAEACESAESDAAVGEVNRPMDSLKVDTEESQRNESWMQQGLMALGRPQVCAL